MRERLRKKLSALEAERKKLEGTIYKNRQVLATQESALQQVIGAIAVIESSLAEDEAERAEQQKNLY